MSVRILIGDCRERLAELPDASIDSVVCDPPYELGFMGKAWDSTGIANDVAVWRECLRVLKPGAHLVAFSSTRTYHRMACAIEDAGFEIRDQLAWCYGAGFPKSHNMDNRRGKEFCGCDGETEPAPERDLRLVRDANVSAALATGETGGQVLFEGLPEQGSPGAMLWTEPAQELADGTQPSLEGRRDAQAAQGELQGRSLCASAGMGEADGAEGRLHHGASARDGADVRLPADANGSGQPHRPQSGKQPPEQSGAVADERGSQAWGGWPLCARCGKPDIPRGLGTALKPAWEPICLARKPLIGTVAANMAAHGTGALNIDGCRIETAEEITATRNYLAGAIEPGGTKKAGERVFTKYEQNALGRWPANLIHDGSDEVLAGFPESDSPQTYVRRGEFGREFLGKGSVGSYSDGDVAPNYGDSGSAARFFYCAKATTEERGEGNNHPTVKPIDLMRWLCRLVTPKGGTVLDPFAGSGSTLIAADAEQFDAIGCELSPDYAAIAERRVRNAAGMFAEVKVA